MNIPLESFDSGDSMTLVQWISNGVSTVGYAVRFFVGYHNIEKQAIWVLM